MEKGLRANLNRPTTAKAREKREISQSLDEKYLGQRFQGTPEQRASLLENLFRLVQEEGEEWVRKNRYRLLEEAQFMVDDGDWWV
jgi:hypothetical protein